MGKGLVDLIPIVGVVNAVRTVNEDLNQPDDGLPSGIKQAMDFSYVIGQGVLNVAYLAAAVYAVSEMVR
jgi:hypothetical protein